MCVNPEQMRLHAVTDRANRAAEVSALLVQWDVKTLRLRGEPAK